MCMSAIVNGKECSTQRELRDAIGLSRLPKLGRGCEGDADEDEYCLCGIDVKEAASRAGMDCEKDTFSFYITRPSVPDDEDLNDE